MWQCPNSKREFISTNQKHYCGDKPKTIDDYIASQGEDVRIILNQVRDKLRVTLPDAKERISYSMPTYWKNHNIIHFAANKNHLGLYPGDKAIVHFQEKLSEYNTSKGAIQFPYQKPLPLELIVEIARWCYEDRNH